MAIKGRVLTVHNRWMELDWEPIEGDVSEFKVATWCSFGVGSTAMWANCQFGECSETRDPQGDA